MYKLFSLLTLGLLVFSNAHATSISVLRGDNFRNDLGYRSSKTTLTIENFAIWDYGTIFFYYDITDPMGRDAGPQYYSNQFFGGISPTISLSKVTGKQIKYGIIQDVSIRLELENGSGNGQFNFQTYFYGLQADLLVPGFDFFSFNVVARDNPMVHGVGVQLGMFWQSTLEYGQWRKFKLTGFLATSPWDGNNNDKTNPTADPKGRFLTAQPQFLWDLGYALNGKADKTELGIEYAYFLNRYQAYKKDEKSVQAMVKFSF